MRTLCLFVLSFGIGQLACTQAGAGAIVTKINPDARTEGMGGAGGAVWWSTTPDPWSNPALLGYHQGITYHRFRSELVPDFADDIVITANRLTLGYKGFGILVQQGPLETYLDMGWQMATDEEGNEIGAFESYEKWQGFGLGFSAARFIAGMLPGSPALTRVARYLDLSLGWVSKDFERLLVPDSALQDRPGGKVSASMNDYGVLGRATLYNSLDGPGLLHALDSALYPAISGWRLTGAYGRSWLNWGDGMIVAADADQADPLPREYRKATSLRLELGLPGALVDVLPPLLARALTPAFAVGKAWEDRWPGYVWDPSVDRYVYAANNDADYREETSGWEVTLLGVLSWRRGHVSVPYGDIDGDTEGWGLGLRLAGVQARYDRATRPQARGLDTVDLTSWSVGVDVLELLAVLYE